MPDIMRSETSLVKKDYAEYIKDNFKCKIKKTGESSNSFNSP